MNARPALDVSRLPIIAFGSPSPLWWGMMSLIAIEAMMFAILIATYFYLRLGFYHWPPPGIPMPGLLVPTINLVIMIVSCIPLYFGSEAAIRNDRRGMQIGMLLNIALALISIALRAMEWSVFNFRWYSNVYGSILWTIMGLHTFDYIASLLSTIVFAVIVFTPRVGEKQRLGVHVDSYTWYFVVAIWIPLYGALYIAPRLF